MKSRTNIEMLQIVAKGLGELRNEVVFVGGGVIELYVDNPFPSDIRPSLDVDCVIEISSRLKYNELENLLRKKKFVNDTSKGAPICRWIYNDILVDIMPIDEKILGFSNIWYESGIKNKISKILNDGTNIFIFLPEYFLATKFEAHKNRGGKDLRQSHDFEDIIYLFDNVNNLIEIIINTDVLLAEYLKKECQNLSDNFGLAEGIESALPYSTDFDRVELIEDMILSIANFKI